MQKQHCKPVNLPFQSLGDVNSFMSVLSLVVLSSRPLFLVSLLCIVNFKIDILRVS